jgi:AcrR family transcriptional regulator
MDMIAAEAGVGKGTLFRRFGDRAGLAQAVLEEQTVALQEAIIRGPAPLGPGAPAGERLKALAAAHLDLMAGRADILAAAEFGVRLESAPYAFYRMHVGVLVREACPEADWELCTDMLLAPLAADMYVNWVRGRGMSHERILATYGMLVDRVLV